MKQDEKSNIFSIRLTALVLLAVLIVIALFFILRPLLINNLANKNSSNEIERGFALSDIQSTSTGNNEVYITKQSDDIWELVTFCDTYSYTVSVTDSDDKKTYDIKKSGDSFLVVGENIKISASQGITNIETPTYSFEYNNDEFDVFSEIGTVSAEQIRKKTTEKISDIYLSEDRRVLYVSISDDDVSEVYSIAVDCGIVTSGSVIYQGEIIKQFTVTNISSFPSKEMMKDENNSD